MKTIDETIEFEKRKAESYKKDIEIFKNIGAEQSIIAKYENLSQQHMQKAEWFEELKQLREEKQDKCKDCAGCTQWKCDCSNTRAKALDDAMAALAKVICSDCGYLKGIECKYKGDNCSVSKPMLEKVISTLESLKATQNS